MKFKLEPDDLDVEQRRGWCRALSARTVGIPERERRKPARLARAESRHLTELIVLMIRGIAPNVHPGFA